MDTAYIHKILKYFVDNRAEISIDKILSDEGHDISLHNVQVFRTKLENQLSLYEFIHSEKNNGQYRITSKGRQAYQHGDPIGYIELLKTKFENEIEFSSLSKEVAKMQKEDIPKSRKLAIWALLIAGVTTLVQIIIAILK